MSSSAFLRTLLREMHSFVALKELAMMLALHWGMTENSVHQEGIHAEWFSH